MEHALSRILAVLTASVLFFLVPVVINLQRQENLLQMAVMEETVEFVDSVRNMGVLTESMMNRYETKIRQLQSGLEIQMVHTTSALVTNGDEIERKSVIRTEADVFRALKQDGKYNLQQKDYFRVEVKKKSQGYLSMFYGYSGEETANCAVYAYYGGSVRYED